MALASDGGEHAWVGGTGAFNNAANWLPAEPPGTTDTAVFDQHAVVPYTVTFSTSPTNEMLFIRDDRVDFSLGGQTYSVVHDVVLGEGFTDDASLEIGGGTLSGEFGFIGFDSSATATVTVNGNGAAWNSTSSLSVGAFGDGFLQVQNGGSVTSESGSLAVGFGSQGSAIVQGTNSSWTNTGPLIVGEFGDGDMIIQSGGTVSSSSGTVGGFGNADGMVTVNGSDSLWDVSGSLTVGDFATGTLSIIGGGSVESTSAEVGFDAMGTVSLSGGTSDWTITGPLTVAEFGDGTLQINSGADVTSTLAAIGAQSGSVGEVTINGAGSSWSAGGTLAVGGSELAAGGSGTLSVGTGSSVSVTDSLFVWDTGTLSLNGGVVSAADIELLGGTLAGDGTVVGDVGGSGIVSPGSSPGVLSIIGAFLQPSAGELQIEIDGLVPGQFDVLDVNGHAELRGKLTVDLGFVPTLGQTFEVMTYDSRGGGFTQFAGVDVVPGLILAPLYGPSGLVLRATLPGDANLDGEVNIADTLEISFAFGLVGASFNQGDLNLDGVVDIFDTLEIAANMTSSSSAAAIALPVPEPASLSLLIAGLLSLAVRLIVRRSA